MQLIYCKNNKQKSFPGIYRVKERDWKEKKTDEGIVRTMMRLSLENRFKTAKEISGDLAELSRETIGRRLREKGLRTRKPTKKPFLT